MAFKNYKEQSRANWGTEDEKLTLEQINTGAILRIADATEAMSKNFVQLQNEVKHLKESNLARLSTIAFLNKSNAALRGHIKRIKKNQSK